jgi:hypothetical protein
MVELNSDSCWQVARDIVSQHIDLSTNTLMVCVRVLHRDYLKGDNEMSISSAYLLSTLVRGKSIQAPLYYAAQTYIPERVSKIGRMSSRSIGKVFTPGELSVLLALSLLYRRMVKWSSLKQYHELTSTLAVSTDIGGFLGLSLPSIGLRKGLLVGGIRYLSLFPLLGSDPSGYDSYVRALQLDGRNFDLESEARIWGTTHLHIASQLVQALGLGLEDARSIIEAFLPFPGSTTDAYYATQITQTWIESLIATGTPPEIVHKGEFYPKARDLDTLKERVAHIREVGSENKFMTRKRYDVTPEKTPILFTGPVDNTPVEVPRMTDELLDGLTPEELAAIEDA